MNPNSNSTEVAAYVSGGTTAETKNMCSSLPTALPSALSTSLFGKVNSLSNACPLKLQCFTFNLMSDFVSHCLKRLLRHLHCRCLWPALAHLCFTWFNVRSMVSH